MSWRRFRPDATSFDDYVRFDALFFGADVRRGRLVPAGERSEVELCLGWVGDEPASYAAPQAVATVPLPTGRQHGGWVVASRSTRGTT
jgi:hypothetical protein